MENTKDSAVDQHRLGQENNPQRACVAHGRGRARVTLTKSDSRDGGGHRGARPDDHGRGPRRGRQHPRAGDLPARQARGGRDRGGQNGAARDCQRGHGERGARRRHRQAGLPGGRAGPGHGGHHAERQAGAGPAEAFESRQDFQN